MKLTGGIMRMLPLAGSIPVHLGRPVQLAPSGFQAMLSGRKKPFAADGTVPVTLHFERADAVRVVFDVRMTPPGPAALKYSR